MASITIASVTIPNWQINSDVQLRVYALQSFIAADGTVVNCGKPSADQTESSNFFVPAACTLSGTNLTIASLALESTTDSQDNPAATYGAFFYTTEGELLAPFAEFAQFVLPSSPSSTTWAAIAQAQQGAL